MLFDRILGKFQLKIKDRQAAGNILGDSLKGLVKKADRSDVIVLGIPRGGLVVAEAIGRKLECRLDFILVRRLRSPFNEELAIGAVAHDGTTYINEAIVENQKISREHINNEVSNQLQEMKRLDTLFDNGNKTLNEGYGSSSNKTIILVDDGAATGATIIAASRSIRNTIKPKQFLLAVPVSPKGTIKTLKNENIDHIEVIISPKNSNFVSVEQFYQNFEQITDEQVIRMIRNLQ